MFNLDNSALRSHFQTLQHRRVESLVRVLFPATAPQCRRGPNSPSFFKKGCPKGGVVICASKFLVRGSGLMVSLREPLPRPSATPSRGKGNWASAAAARSGQGKCSKEQVGERDYLRLRKLWPAPAVFLETFTATYMHNMKTKNSNIFITSFRVQIYIAFNFTRQNYNTTTPKNGPLRNFISLFVLRPPQSPVHCYTLQCGQTRNRRIYHFHLYRFWHPKYSHSLVQHPF